jgi:hypothetical protein
MALVRMDLGGRVRGPRADAQGARAVIRPAIPKPVSRPRDDIGIVTAFVVVCFALFGFGFAAAISFVVH